MNKVLAKIVMLKDNNETVKILYKSEICLEINDLIELFKKCDAKSIKNYGIDVNEIINCLKNVNIKNADSLIIACKLLHKQKRKVCRLVEIDDSEGSLKDFGRLCAVADRSCYQLLKESHNIVRTISLENDESEFCKY